MSRDRALTLAAALVCAALALLLGARSLDVPGLYYDEVIQAEPALWFVRGEADPPEVPGAVSVQLFGRPFPVMTQPYMGALKSQLLIPLFALRSPSAAELRLATLAVAVAGLVVALLLVARVYGVGIAWLFGLLLAVDPSFLFIGRHDWGSFSLGLLLRSAAALALWSAWHARKPARFFLAGLCAGLAVYNKIDAAVALAAAGAALLLVLPQPLRALRERRGGFAFAACGLLLGAAPLLWRALPALAMTQRAVTASASATGEWSEKWHALLAVLDGSYFARLIFAGGSFEHMAGVEGAPATGLPALFLFCSAVFVLWVLYDRRTGQRQQPAHVFALLAAWFTLAALLATPRAIRVHHFLNAWPLPQLVVAIVLGEGWRRSAGRPISRVFVACLIGAALIGALHVNQRTLALLQVTGGKGLWSDALATLAPQLDGARVVTLDWGFAGPLRVMEPELRVAEPVWRLRGQRPVEITGDAGQIYLLHEPRYAVFPFGGALLEALATLPPGSATLTPHTDRTGETAFLSLRFAGPHRLLYRGRRFEVELQ